MRGNRASGASWDITFRTDGGCQTGVAVLTNDVASDGDGRPSWSSTDVEIPTGAKGSDAAGWTGGNPTSKAPSPHLFPRKPPQIGDSIRGGASSPHEPALLKLKRYKGLDSLATGRVWWHVSCCVCVTRLLRAEKEVLMPLDERGQMSDRTPTAPPESPPDQPTMLVADDEDGVRHVMKRMLERAGYRILTASDGPEAVDMCRQHGGEIVAVLLDMTMPQMRGEDVFEQIQRIHPNLPVIFTSGHAEEEVIGHFLGMGVVGFLQKPFRQQELIQKVREALQHSA